MQKVIENNLLMLKLIHKASKFRILFSSISALMDSMIPILNILIVKYVMDLITSKGKASTLLCFLSSILVVNIIIIIYSAWYNQKYCIHSDLYIKQYIKKVIYTKVQYIDMESFDKPDFYSTYKKAIQETSSRAINVLNTLTNLLKYLLSFFGVISIIIWMDPLVILFVFVSVCISVLLSNKQSKKNYLSDMDQVETNRKIDYISRVFYLKQFAKEIKVFKLSPFLIKKYDDIVNNLHHIRKKYENSLTAISFLQNLNQIILVFGIILYLGLKIINGSLSVGDFAGLLNASQELGNSIQQVFSIIPSMIQNSLYIDNIKQFLQHQASIEAKDKGMSLETVKHDIVLNNVSFKYVKEGPYVLKNICLTIHHDETISIVGYNGSGKTTLIKNILRLYDPTDGNITIDGYDYREYNVHSLRRRIGVVFQDFQYYATTIAENVLLRSVETPEDEKLVWRALEISGLAKKVSTFEKTIYTMLTKEFDEHGVVLSGGELQKLALSRAFAQNYDVIILDEPSSALDPVAEYDLYNRIIKMTTGKILIFISHRLSTTRNADRIIYMEKGRIEEIGTHDELMALNQKYAYLFNLQAQNYRKK